MPKTKELPPPPENPVTSPSVLVAGEEALTLEGAAGQPRIQALLRVPEAARRAVLLCHPHPLYGGTMHSAVVVALAKVLAERGGVATLRFNYRGVGKSEGAYDHGQGETEDARLALRTLADRCPRAKVAVAGYSFGTWVGLRAAALEGRVERVALIAPAVRVFTFLEEDARAFQGRIAVYLGDDDEFCDVEEGEALAKKLGASFTLFPGSDHYFLAGRRKLAEAVVPFLDPVSGDRPQP